MYNPYYYLNEQEKQKLLRLRENRERRKAVMRVALASLSESRSLNQSLSDLADTKGSLTTGSGSVSGGTLSGGSPKPGAAAESSSPKIKIPWQHPGTPWAPSYNLSSILRTRDASKDIPAEQPFQSTYWRATQSLQEQSLQAENLTLPQPKYADPGFNHRNGEFCYAPHAYNLRMREKAREVSQIPWKNKGERTEQERISLELVKHGSTLTLPPLQPPSLKEDPSTWVGPRMITAFPRVGRYFEKQLQSMGSAMSGDYRDNPHPHSVLYVQQFRPREMEKEIRIKDPVKQRMGFVSRVRSGTMFEKFQWQPL